MAQTKNIIFDLGGVLLNIDYDKTVIAFEKLGIENFQEMCSPVKADDLFKSLEKGELGEKDFYDAIKKRSGFKITDEQIADAWNALIIDFRTESLRLLEKITAKYKLYLLSNTNSIHLKCFQQKLKEETGKPGLDNYFIKAWYSHQVGLRKPGAEIYEFVLQEGNLVAGETLFIDDTLANIETAGKLGFKTHHLKPTERIEDILE